MSYRYDDGLGESFNFDHGELLVLTATVGHIDDFSVQ